MVGTFTKNTLFTFTTRALTAAFGLGISIIIARVLGPEGKGIYALAVLLPGLLVTFTNLGINPATVFNVAKNRYPAREIFGNNIILTVFISIFTVLVGLVIIFFFGSRLFPGTGREYLLLALCLIPLNFFFDFISSILIGLQKLTTYNVLCFLQSFIFLILVGALILGLQFGVKAAISAQIIAYLSAGIVLFFSARKVTGGVLWRPNKEYLKDASFYGIKANLGSMISFLHLRANLFLINIFLNPAAVGLYSAAVGIAEGMWLISRSASTVLFPRVASETDPRSLKQFTPLVCRNVLLVALILVVVLIVFSRWLIVLLYSEAFLESVQPFRILLIGTFVACGHGVLVNDLMARGRPMLVSYIAGVPLILNIILNIFWIPLWGISGAAWATTVSYSIMFIITIFIYGKISGNKIKDIILPQKSDFKYYGNLLRGLKLLKLK